MKTIVYIAPVFLPYHLSGSEMLLYTWAKAAQKNGDRVIVVTSDIADRKRYFFPFIGRFDQKNEVIDNIEVVRLSHHWYVFLFAHVIKKLLEVLKLDTFSFYTTFISYTYGIVFRNLYSCLEKLDPDIIHTTPFPHAYTFQTSKVIRKLRQKKYIKFIITPAFHFNEKVFKQTYNISQIKKVLQEVDVLVCTTLYEAKKARKIFALPEEKIRVVPIGIPKADITKNEKLHTSFVYKEVQKAKKQKKNIIFFLGTRNFDKGIFHLIEAIDMLQQSADKALLFVGGEQTRAWERFIKNNEREYIIDLPYMSRGEKEYLFSQSDIFALPSCVDSYGIVYIEAMSNGLPILFADEHQQKEIIHDAGLSASFMDVPGLSQNIAMLLHDKTLRREIGKRGYQRYLQKFTLRQMEESIAAIYLL